MRKILVIPGDGIGPEITEATMKVLKATILKYGINVEFVVSQAGDEAFRKFGDPLPQNTLKLAEKAEFKVNQGTVVKGRLNVGLTFRLWDRSWLLLRYWLFHPYCQLLKEE